jgi:hypothetical protein
VEEVKGRRSNKREVEYKKDIYECTKKKGEISVDTTDITGRKRGEKVKRKMEEIHALGPTARPKDPSTAKTRTFAFARKYFFAATRGS